VGSSIDRYLRRIDGLDAEIWVRPSRGQLFWLRHLPTMFGADPRASGPLARWWGIATVTPATNVTGLNLRYQAYLNLVFHRTRLARVGHAICMPLIVAAALAALCPVRLGSWSALPGLALPVNASLPAAIGLAAWWVVWAVKERDAVWGMCAPFQTKTSSGWTDASSFRVALAVFRATSGERSALFLPIGRSSSSRLTPGSDGASSELEVRTVTSWRSRSRLTVSAHSTSYPPRTAGGKRLLMTRIRIPSRVLRTAGMGT